MRERCAVGGYPGPGLLLLVLAALAAHVLDPGTAAAFPPVEDQIRIGSALPLAAGLPFAGILLSIALLPQVSPKLWGRHYGKIAAFWALMVAAPFGVHFGSVAAQEIASILVTDYLPFIVLLWALYTVAGGILVTGGFNGTPGSNALFLGLGTALASIAGTTGAAMLLIRPLLRANAWRRRRVHQVVFFIFLACNVGGSLTPLGDPPLFLGFLHGVPFLWTLRLFPATAAVSLALIAVFFALDRYLARGDPGPPPHPGRLRVEGRRNLTLLAAILVAVMVSGSWELGELSAFSVHRPVSGLLRDGVLVAIGALSLRLTPEHVRSRNGFTWEPIREVAILFPGIFVAMAPVLLILKAGEHGELAFVHAALRGPQAYFWLTGVLSSVLDNTPTYLVFLGAALGAFGHDAAESEALALLIRDYPVYLKAVSAGAVFFGAVTYLGNAPNLLVRSIAQEAGIAMPSFGAYTAFYAVPVLVPAFAVVSWWFL